MINRMLAWRTRMDLTQEEAAAQLGISLSCMKQYEGKNFRVPPVPIQRLCRALEIERASVLIDTIKNCTWIPEVRALTEIYQ